jgi:GntR family histidine utilization transcriptional repressor
VVPSEQALVRQFGVSRMTVNRAVRELTAESGADAPPGFGHLRRAAKIPGHPGRNPQHRRRSARARPCPPQQLLLLERAKASELLAKQFDLPAGHALFHSVIVHYENGADPGRRPLGQPGLRAGLHPAGLHQHHPERIPGGGRAAAGRHYSLEALAAPRDIADMLAMEHASPASC